MFCCVSMQRFLSLEAMRLECTREFRTKNEKTASPSEQLCKKEKRPVDAVSSISRYSKEIEEIEEKLEVISTRCHYVENKVTGKQV